MSGTRGSEKSVFQFQQAIRLLLAVVGLAAAAQFSFAIPGTDIPQTGQTIAVLLSGAMLRPGQAALAVMLYLLAGLLGLPVYSDGGSGWSALSGISAGYFAGFVAAAYFCAVLIPAKRQAMILFNTGVFIIAHGLILALGWAWMSLEIGARTALSEGVTPFVYGGLVKSLICAGLLYGWHWLLSWQLWSRQCPGQ
ncbi:MAG: biotin transporter BioY [Pseudomonadales bacterium]|nr:biotin transporter BioY [Pseudomonadales bacterium]